MMRQLNILFLLTLFVHCTFGQEKIDWLKYDCAAFKEDTTRGFISTAYYKKADCAPFSDITTSDAIFELRVVPTSKVLMYGNRTISIFKFYEDSAILTKYYRDTDTAFEIFRKQYRDSSNEAFAKGVTPLLEKNCGINWRVNKRNLSQSEASKIIEDLVQMNLFTIETGSEIETIEKRINNDSSYTAILKTHQLNKGPVNYRFSVSLEIKYKSKYRVFRTGGVFFYFKDKYNGMESSIGGFMTGAELFKYLNSKADK